VLSVSVLIARELLPNSLELPANEFQFSMMCAFAAFRRSPTLNSLNDPLTPPEGQT
jgi:hypothetical protein